VNQQANDEVLTATDLAAIRVFLTTQNMLGQRAPAFTAQTILALMAQLDTLSGAYPQIRNATMKGWVNKLYDSLQSVNTDH
jgi:hypothetical protein